MTSTEHDKSCRACPEVLELRKKVRKLSFSIPCPPDSEEIGRHTWTFLHTMSVHYPEHPTLRQQLEMKSLLRAIGTFYPCSVCAEHFREISRRSPPRVDSRETLARRLCERHNEVNESIGKETFDCRKVFERWLENPRCE